MFFMRFLVSTAVLATSAVTTAQSQTLELPGGMHLGATFDQFWVVAAEHGWSIEPSTVSSNTWSVAGLGHTFRFCDKSLVSVDQTIDGGLSAFVDTVHTFQLEFGQPETNIFVLLPGSAFELRGVQSRFEPDEHSGISVTIETRDQVNRVWMRRSDGSVCEGQ